MSVCSFCSGLSSLHHRLLRFLRQQHLFGRCVRAGEGSIIPHTCAQIETAEVRSPILKLRSFFCHRGGHFCVRSNSSKKCAERPGYLPWIIFRTHACRRTRTLFIAINCSFLGLTERNEYNVLDYRTNACRKTRARTPTVYLLYPWVDCESGIGMNIRQLMTIPCLIWCKVGSCIQEFQQTDHLLESTAKKDPYRKIETCPQDT